MWNESLTYHAKTPSKQRPNAAPLTLKPVTTPVKKWRLSNRNHNDNNIQNEIYPPPASATSSTHTTSTTSTFANNGMKAIENKNGVSLTRERDDLQRKRNKFREK